MKRRANMSCLFTQSTEPISSNLVPVKITLLHDNQNRNYTDISIEAIREAESSLKNKPILAYIRKDENGEYDFAGHEIEITLTDNGIKETYLERPVGIIPESTKVEYTSKDGKIYASCMGYIYKDYSNETLELIEKTNGKCVSVELAVNDGYSDMDNIFHITKFDYLGITILSDDITPGMDENCRLELFGNLDDYKEFINKAKADVYSFEKEEYNAEKNNTEEEPQKTENEDITEDKNPIEHTDIEESNNINTQELDLSIFKDLFETNINSLEVLKGLFISRINELEEKISVLEKYRNDNEYSKREIEVKNILEKFSIDEDSVVEIKEKVLSFEATLEDFEKELYVIIGKNALKNNKKQNFSFKGINLNNTEKNREKEKIYNGLLDNILGCK